MKEIIQHVSPLDILLVPRPTMIRSGHTGSWSCSTSSIFMLLTSSSLLLLVSIPGPTLVPRCSELCRFLGCERDRLWLDTEELFPSWRLLGGNRGWRFSFWSVGRGLVPGGGYWSWCRRWSSLEPICLGSEIDQDEINVLHQRPIITYPWLLLSANVSTGGGGRGSLRGISCSWSGAGGGGGDGVQLRPEPILDPVGGEHGGVGNLGFLFRVDLRGNVFFSANVEDDGDCEACKWK